MESCCASEYWFTYIKILQVNIWSWSLSLLASEVFLNYRNYFVINSFIYFSLYLLFAMGRKNSFQTSSFQIYMFYVLSHTLHVLPRGSCWSSGQLIGFIGYSAYGITGLPSSACVRCCGHGWDQRTQLPLYPLLLFGFLSSIPTPS